MTFLPFEIADDVYGLGGLVAPDEGFRWIRIAMGIENSSDSQLAFDEEYLTVLSEKVNNASVLTAEGNTYDTNWSDFYGLPAFLPPGFRMLRHAQFIHGYDSIFPPSKEYADNFDFVEPIRFEYLDPIIHLKAQVPQNATNPKLLIPGYDPLALDAEQARQTDEAGNGAAPTDLENLGSGVSFVAPNENIQVTVVDLAGIDDPITSLMTGIPFDEEFYDYYRLDLDYANLDQGYTQEGEVDLWVVDHEGGIIRLEIIPEESGSDQFQFGPGISRRYFSLIALPKGSLDATILIEGRVFEAYKLVAS